jgi:hypothetical protein
VSWGAIATAPVVAEVPAPQAATRFRSPGYIMPSGAQRKRTNVAEDDHELMHILVRFLDTIDEI